MFMQQMVNGFSLGSMYALIAIGYTMVYGVLRLINFAHGALYMLGAFLAWMGLNYLGLNYWIMLIVAPVQDSLFGFVIVANTAIGVIQEYRAARTLAKLAVIGEAKPVVRRDGVDVEVRPHDVCVG